MRNIAFALQARNQLKRIDRFVVRGYCRTAAPMFCGARAESAINRTRSTKSVGKNRLAQNQFLDTAIDTSTLRHRCVVEAGRRSANPGLFVVASARRVGEAIRRPIRPCGESKRIGPDLFADRSGKA
jgi:hypothetical protein